MDPMRILYVADGRSPTAANWIGNLVRAGMEVHLASTFPCEPLPGSASHTVVPVAFSGLSPSGGGSGGRSGLLRRITTPGLRTTLRQILGLPTLRRASLRLRALTRQLRPDMVHALRIPFEGMLAAMAVPFLPEEPDIPLLVSVWGNDFTLHANANPWLSRFTRLVMSRAQAVLADSQRDLNLARRWGLAAEKRTCLLPGGGGVDTSIFHPPQTRSGPPLVVNARGYRAYVHTEAFFQAIPKVLEAVPEALFACTGMVGHPQTEVHQMQLEQAGAAKAVRMLPQLPHSEMGELFRSATIAVSPASHDGTPNTLLEAMACGTFPVAGNIESLREWIRDGENGLLVDPRSPGELAAAIVRAIQSPGMLARAADINTALVEERAARASVLSAALDFYRNVSQGGLPAAGGPPASF
jgi:glycosyltransferase involved in cell wall biosynthesis